MQYSIKVIPQAKRDLVKVEDKVLKVYLTAPAVDGKANKALIKVLAEHFDVRKRQVTITKGLKSREKVIKIRPLT